MRTLVALILGLLLVLPPMADAVALQAGPNQDHHHFNKAWHGQGHAHKDHAAATADQHGKQGTAVPGKSNPDQSDDPCPLISAALTTPPMTFDTPPHQLLVVSVEQSLSGITGPPPLHPPLA